MCVLVEGRVLTYDLNDLCNFFKYKQFKINSIHLICVIWLVINSIKKLSKIPHTKKYKQNDKIVLAVKKFNKFKNLHSGITNNKINTNK